VITSTRRSFKTGFVTLDRLLTRLNANKPEFVEGAQATRNPTPHQRISRHSSKLTVALICINDPILKSH
jgi:hypothetical protein